MFFLPHLFQFIDEKSNMPYAKKKSTDRFGSRKGSKRKQLQQAREGRAKMTGKSNN